MLDVGATVGAAIAGTLNDKFGRWKVMMTSTILHIVAAVVMVLAFSEIPLVIGIAVTGLAIGILTCCIFNASKICVLQRLRLLGH